MNEKILEAYDFLILFGFYGLMVCLVIGCIALLYVIFFGGPRIDPASTPEWQAKEKEYYGNPDNDWRNEE